ncbi:histamine H3 receptor-like [Gastrophryne carolinensis]
MQHFTGTMAPPPYIAVNGEAIVPVMRRIISISVNSAGNGTNITGTNTSFVTDEMETLGPQSMLILITVLVAFLILGTVLGNTLVIVAFIEDKRLRNSHHLFLLNLAICDFFIGAFCIPLYVPYVVTGKWMLGKSLCKLWLVVDNLMCTASAFNVVLISYDRFLAVTMAVLYRSQQYCHGKTVLKMATVWLLSSLLYSPAILLWENFQSNSSIPEGLCLPTYYYNWHFLLAASTFDFLLPLLSISFFNISIYWNIRTRSIKKCRQAMLPDALTNGQQVPYIIPLGLTSEWLHDLSETQKNVFRESVCQNLKRYFCKKAKPVPLERTLGQSSYIRIVKLSQDKKVAKSLFILITQKQLTLVTAYTVHHMVA